LPFDPEGRVVIPEELRAHAAIDGEALFVGGGRNRFQIWCPEVFERHRLEAIERARSRGATLPLQPRVEVRP
jgi:MraZ protein